MPAVVVTYGVLQDALKQQGQLFGGFRCIFVDEFEHGILHDIQCHMLVPHREQGLLVGAALGFGEEAGKFVVAGQFALPLLISREY